MINNLIELFFLIKFPLIVLFVTFGILSFYWKSIFKFLKLKSYKNIQRVHKNEISRLGGLAIYIFFWIIYLFDFIKDQFFASLLISAIPFVLISLKEDLFHNTKPKNRLILMIISCLIFFYMHPINFPIVDIPYFGEVISSYPVSIIFFTFSVLVVMNGMNLIDGMNGLFAFTVLSILISLAYLLIIDQDEENLKLIFLFSAPLLIFLFFNFPIGKIFIGDTGAYLYGFIVSILTIKIFGKHPELLTWLAVFILFYPSIELLFSFIRKAINNTSPFKPDSRHLHSLIFLILFYFFKKVHLSNNLTTLTLFIFWLSPPFFVIYLNNLLTLSIILVLYFLVYLYIYKLVSNKEKSLK